MEGHYEDCLNPADCWCEVRRLFRVFWIAVAIFGIEIVGGVVSGSLALLADAGHVLADNTAIVVSIIIAVLVKLGYRKKSVRNIGFRINVALLIFVAVWIFWEAFARFGNPREIIGWMMMIAASLGAVGNYIQHRILEGAAHEHKHKMHGALSVHVLSDLMMSVGVVAGGAVILFTGWVMLDPILSAGIAVWILWRTYGLVKNPRADHFH